MESRRHRSRGATRAAAAALGLAVTLVAHAAPTCRAQAPARAPMVVELYTSEGCSSCPPADRWLSTLCRRSGVLALAFHVDYWDRLGWRDRFADPAYTWRQVESLRSSGARQPYTPQVIVDGVDRPGWRRLDPPGALPRPAATVDVGLVREGADYRAELRARAGAPDRLTAFWAVTEDGHSTAVYAGENGGATLRHDFVVREYRLVPPWRADATLVQTVRFTPSTPEDPEHPRRVHLVVVDADSGRPVQAVAIAC